MHEIARLARLIALGLLFAVWPADAHTPASPSRTIVLGAVMEYRLNWIGDSTSVNACQVFLAAGAPANFPAGIPVAAQRLLDGRVDGCGGTKPGAGPGGLRRTVVVDSLRPADSLAYVFVTVHRGELTHRENYVLRTPTSRPDFAGVKSVTLWGAIQIHPTSAATGCSPR